MNPRDAADLRRTSLRLALQFGVLILILFGLLGGVTVLIVGSSQAEETTRTLVDADIGGSPEHAPHDVLLATDIGGKLDVSPGAPSWFPDQSGLSAARKTDDAVQVTKTIGGHTYAIRTDKDHGRLTQEAIDTGQNSAELKRLVLALAISGVIAAIAAATVSVLMARRAMRPMVDALSLQRRFVTDASHELRTPLTLLSTRAQLLRRELPSAIKGSAGSAQIARGLDEILQDSRDLSGILEDLLVAADPRETATRAPLDLNDLAREAIELVAVDAKSRGIDVRGASGSDPIMINGSRASLFRLYNSLISNAVDHATSAVTVTVSAAGRNAEIRVLDDGHGFAEGMSERAFERFATSRGDSPDTGPRHYGLGLALVAEVASRHDGRVMVEPRRPGTGAEILVQVPLSDA